MPGFDDEWQVRSRMFSAEISLLSAELNPMHHGSPDKGTGRNLHPGRNEVAECRNPVDWMQWESAWGG